MRRSVPRFPCAVLEARGFSALEARGFSVLEARGFAVLEARGFSEPSAAQDPETSAERSLFRQVAAEAPRVETSAPHQAHGGVAEAAVEAAH